MTVDTASDNTTTKDQPSMLHDAPPRKPLIRRLLDGPELMIFGSLIIIIAIFTVMAPAAFLSGINLRNMAIEASMMMILAVGMTYVIIASGIDLSVGAVLVFSSVASLIAMRATGSDAPWVPVLGLVVSLASGALWGARQRPAHCQSPAYPADRHTCQHGHRARTGPADDRRRRPYRGASINCYLDRHRPSRGAFRSSC
ncbi:hypothetical protein Q1M64_19745 [Sinorhizobium meliloti]|nr:hypothetical protein Q1M64_19745 [Sinorhizobium meliloti]